MGVARAADGLILGFEDFPKLLAECARAGRDFRFSAISDPTLLQFQRAYGKRFQVG